MTNFHEDDLVLTINEPLIHKYDSFLDVFSPKPFGFQKDAIRHAISFLCSKKYPTISSLAKDNFKINPTLALYYQHREEAFLKSFHFGNKKSASIDLATGTGKSYVLYAIAVLSLIENIVDKVLILCPSITIEQQLTEKFKTFNQNSHFFELLREVDPNYSPPEIKDGTDTIEENVICIENIQTTYHDTSSIPESFHGFGKRTLVLNDEAHHLFSSEREMRQWMLFLQDEAYDFNYMIHVTGTPYSGRNHDQYFQDVIFRYGIDQALNDNVIKQVDYKFSEDMKEDKGFYETYHNHQRNRIRYGDYIKPVTLIVVDNNVDTCLEVYDQLVEFLVKREEINEEFATKKAIWVASTSPNERNNERKANLEKLKTVDQLDNPVEWIVSVNMLTEGWDVKNVFQIVPHVSRAFKSRLLISQVLGRGLRRPNLPHTLIPYVKVNNHEKWSENIDKLCRGVLGIDLFCTWGIPKDVSSLSFPIFNLKYEQKTIVKETKGKEASPPSKIDYKEQPEALTSTSNYTKTGVIATNIPQNYQVSINDAVAQIKIFLKEKDPQISSMWNRVRIKNLIQDNLKSKGYDYQYLSKENLAITKKSFGPLFRKINEKMPREKIIPTDIFETEISNLSRQNFSEKSLVNNGHLYYNNVCLNSLTKNENKNLSYWIKHYPNRVSYIEPRKFKTPLDLIYVEYNNEKEFMDQWFENHRLFDSILKSPNQGFYALPYSFKLSNKHSMQHHQFNPDFIMKVFKKPVILIVEIKADGDKTEQNKAKQRDAIEHFQLINNILKSKGKDWRYYFYFLSPVDYEEFFDEIGKGNYKWTSTLMEQLLT